MSLFRKLFIAPTAAPPSHEVATNMSALRFEQMTEPGLLNLLFTLLPTASTGEATRAARAVQRIFVDIHTQGCNALYTLCKYLPISATDTERYAQFPSELKISLLCIATLNGNGYTRERALMLLSGVTDEPVFRFIVYRLSDWVEPVRTKAAELIEGYLRSEQLPVLICNYKLINKLIMPMRHNLSELYEHVTTFLAEQPLPPEVLMQFNEGERYFYYKLLVKKETIAREQAERMSRDPYYLIRMLVVENMQKTDIQPQLIDLLHTDKSRGVRHALLKVFGQYAFEGDQFFAETMLFDTAAGIRAQARELLAQRGSADFATLYRHQLASSNQRTEGALLGLSEVGNKEDITLINSYLDSENASLQAAALRALSKLDRQAALEKSYSLLSTTEKMKVLKAVVYLLRAQPVDVPRLRSSYDTAGIEAKRAILGLLLRGGGWSVAGDFIKAMADDNARIRQQANKMCEAWCKYSVSLFTAQTEADKTYVKQWYAYARSRGVPVPDTVPFMYGFEEREL